MTQIVVQSFNCNLRYRKTHSEYRKNRKNVHLHKTFIWGGSMVENITSGAHVCGTVYSVDETNPVMIGNWIQMMWQQVTRTTPWMFLPFLLKTHAHAGHLTRDAS